MMATTNSWNPRAQISKQQIEWFKWFTIRIHACIDAVWVSIEKFACRSDSKLQLTSTAINNSDSRNINHRIFGPRRKRERESGKSEPKTNRAKRKKIMKQTSVRFLRNGSALVPICTAQCYCCYCHCLCRCCCFGCYVCIRCTCVCLFHQHHTHTHTLLIELNECEKA